jgi:hypothetical protein
MHVYLIQNLVNGKYYVGQHYRLAKLNALEEQNVFDTA